MEFREITDKKNWNEFILSNEGTDILQSWEWGETKRIEGWEPYRMAIVDCQTSKEEQILIGAQVLVKEVKYLGNLGYIPHGVVLSPESENDNDQSSYWRLFEEGLVGWAKRNNLFAIEMEPKVPEEDIQEFLPMKSSKNWKITGRNRQPKYKLLTDITKSEDEILAGMKKKTRYNIRYAEKKGVEVKKYSLDDPNIEEVIDRFHGLLLDMQIRTKGYPIRSKKYFLKLVEEFKDSGNIEIFEASCEGDTIIMNISEFTNVWASSFYAGSNRLHSNVKAAYLIRWESMLEAKKRGCSIYDFWGIVPNSEQHKGYSDHKLSFGGDRVDFVGILMYPINIKAQIWDKGLKAQSKYNSMRWG